MQLKLFISGKRVLDNALFNTLVIIKDAATPEVKVKIRFKALRDKIAVELIQAAIFNGYEPRGIPFPGINKSYAIRSSALSLRLDNRHPHFPMWCKRGYCKVHNQPKYTNSCCKFCKVRMCWDICYERFHSLENYGYDDPKKTKYTHTNTYNVQKIS